MCIYRILDNQGGHLPPDRRERDQPNCIGTSTNSATWKLNRTILQNIMLPSLMFSKIVPAFTAENASALGIFPCRR